MESIIVLIVIVFIIAIILYKIFIGKDKAYTASANSNNIEEGAETELKCLRCFDTKMIYNGIERLHVGSNAAPFLLGDLGELAVEKQTFDLYYCPNCGKVEWYFRKK